MATERDEVWTHIDRCIECYSGQGGGINVAEAVDRDSYETMRADLMLAIGMLMALYCRARAPETAMDKEARKP